MRQSIELSRIIEVLKQGSDTSLLLPPGTFEITTPIVLNRPGVKVRGATDGERLLTRFKRGRLRNGEFYKGPLLQIAGTRNVEITQLAIEGSRFEMTSAGLMDLRHPRDADRSSALFLYARQGGRQSEASSRVSDFEADVLIVDSQAITLRNLSIRNAVRVGVGLGPLCRDITLNACEIGGAGDYGVWMGAALPANPPLPLDPVSIGRLPAKIAIESCLVECCGASGIYAEARGVTIRTTDLLQNHLDAPYDDEGGQLVIDYKAENVEVNECRILAGAMVRRASGSDGQGRRVLGCFGVEASGRNLVFKDVLIEGNSREGIQLIGARDVEICGSRTRVINNHLAEVRYPNDSEQGQRHNISVTNIAELFKLNVVAKGLHLRDVRCENGVVIWSHPSKDDLTFDDLVVERCDLTGPDASGVSVGRNSDGRSLQGSGWFLQHSEGEPGREGEPDDLNRFD